MTKHQPLTIEGIDEGRFLVRSNADLAAMQTQLLAYVREHKDLAEGAKAKLSLEITICADNVKGELFTVKAVPKLTLPSRPPCVSYAIAEELQDGTPALFVKASGGDAYTPRQTKLCTDDGRDIDPETGEPAAKPN